MNSQVCSMRLGKIQLIILGTLIASVFSFYSAFAQGSDTNMQQTELEAKINKLDNLLNISITGSLTGLSLTGSTFLMRLIKNEEDDRHEKQILNAKKSLVKAFVLFLACTVAIFVFDFIEIVYNASLLMLTLDLAISYGLFFSGLAFLTFAAKEIYITQAK